ncbi:MAG TPA: cell division ATP-binding protein FtsE [Longimicrobiaceae bacterium]|nr:cell division ATP-binding protein FtsE [Longimicrobiaceae bacterium]
MIKFTSVYKEYSRSGLALRDVTFHVRKGDFAFLTGHSGAGKSTVMRLLQMAELPSAGEVRVSGFASTRLRRGDVPRLRRRLGVVFQDFRLLADRTAEENVAFALEVTGAKRSTIRTRVGRLLSQVGLAAKARSLPEELSGGERQRVAIARALANDPLVLLADEPTGNLDEWSAKGVFDLFKEINAGGTTVVMATHNLDLVRANPAFRVLELSHGELVFDSGAEQIAAEEVLP